MNGKYIAFATRLRARMQAVGIKTNVELGVRLENARARTGENMISRWTMGHARPWGDRLEALLDVLGVVDVAQRNEWKAEAYSPASSNRLEEDDIATVVDPPTPPGAA